MLLTNCASWGELIPRPSGLISLLKSRSAGEINGRLAPPAAAASAKGNVRGTKSPGAIVSSPRIVAKTRSNGWIRV